jgi:NADPH-dependent ferric siderophore reductase
VTRSPLVHSMELAARLGAVAAVCDVVATTQLSPSLTEVTLRGNALALTGQPGNDVMVLVGESDEHVVRRRYSVRHVVSERDEFTLWVTTGHDGDGASWARAAMPGDQVDVIGPRGKILIAEDADWHLFMGDVSSLASFYRMAESISAPSQALFVVEISHSDDALTTRLADGVGVTGVFVDRAERAPSDPAGLLSGLAALTLPPGRGHAYLFGEFAVMRALARPLADRGLESADVSSKAFWRAGRANAAHGEPVKSDD